MRITMRVAIMVKYWPPKKGIENVFSFGWFTITIRKRYIYIQHNIVTKELKIHFN